MVFPLLSNKIAFFKFIGIPKSLDSPLPDPAGIIAKVVVVLTKLLETSFTDPSPPTATITSNLGAFSVVILMACFALSVYFIV